GSTPPRCPGRCCCRPCVRPRVGADPDHGAAGAGPAAPPPAGGDCAPLLRGDDRRRDRRRAGRLGGIREDTSTSRHGDADPTHGGTAMNTEDRLTELLRDTANAYTPPDGLPGIEQKVAGHRRARRIRRVALPVAAALLIAAVA